MLRNTVILLKCLVPDGYTTSDVVFVWSSIQQPVQIGTIGLPEFHLVDYSTGDCTVAYITGESQEKKIRKKKTKKEKAKRRKSSVCIWLTKFVCISNKENTCK